jgi:hypothetical protein
MRIVLIRKSDLPAGGLPWANGNTGYEFNGCVVCLSLPRPFCGVSWTAACKIKNKSVVLGRISQSALQAIFKTHKINKTTSMIPQFKNEPIIVLVLSIITCGLYLIYWNIKAAEVMNAAAEKEIISQPIAIFAGCCLPVNLYFYYLAGREGLPKIYEKTGETGKDQSTLLLILGFFSQWLQQ